VPVGIALIDASIELPDAPQRIDAPTSYLAVNELLSRFIADSPFDAPALQLSRYTQNLPETVSVAENEGTVIMQIGEHFMMRTPDGKWTPWE
jgi:hypothetical protein